MNRNANNCVGGRDCVCVSCFFRVCHFVYVCMCVCVRALQLLSLERRRRRRAVSTCDVVIVIGLT